MKIIIQRVKKAKVSNKKGEENSIQQGMMILLGVSNADTEKDVNKLVEKISKIRIFQGEKDKEFDKDINEINGEILLVSQFTLYGTLKKGRRPEFTQSAKSEKAMPIYEVFIKTLKSKNINVKTGWFGEEMQVELTNDGPVTIILESNNI